MSARTAAVWGPSDCLPERARREAGAGESRLVYKESPCFPALPRIPGCMGTAIFRTESDRAKRNPGRCAARVPFAHLCGFTLCDWQVPRCVSVVCEHAGHPRQLPGRFLPSWPGRKRPCRNRGKTKRLWQRFAFHNKWNQSAEIPLVFSASQRRIEKCDQATQKPL